MERSRFRRVSNTPQFDSEVPELPNQSDSPKPLLELLDLVFFKTRLCGNVNPHNYKICPFYHNVKDQRRSNANYQPEMCQIVEKGKECHK